MRIKLLLLTLLLPMTAGAVDFKFSGEFRSRATYILNKDLQTSTGGGDLALFDSRMRLTMNAAVTPRIRFIYNMQVGDITWGDMADKADPYTGLIYAAGGNERSLGNNLLTRQMYMSYAPGTNSFLRIGFQPFSTPARFVLDSQVPGISAQLTAGFLRFKLLYARSFSGPAWTGSGDDINSVYTSSTLDTMNLGDDRNDYYFDIQAPFGKPFNFTVWFLRDDNNRFSKEAPTTKKMYLDLYYYGLKAFGKLGGVFKYDIDLVINTGVIEAVGEGKEALRALGLRAFGHLSTPLFELKFQYRMTSGNSYSETGPGNDVKQFQVLGTSEHSNGSWLSLLFGGGPFAHQSLFYYGNSSARRGNLTSGYFVRDDPGITSFEASLEKHLHGGTTVFRMIVGYALATHALQNSAGDDVYGLGFEFDIGLTVNLDKALTWDLRFAYLFPGEALAPALGLDNAIWNRPAFGQDPAFQFSTAVSLRF